MNIRIIIFALISLFAISANAHDLTSKQVDALQKRVKQKVEEFQGYHSVIVNNSLSEKHRLNAISSALALFMGKGKAYTTVDEYDRIVNHKPVTMQISSVNKSFKKTMDMTDYLDGQYKNTLRYEKVRVESADVVRVGQIHKVAEDQYVCTAYFCSKYISYNKEGRIVYGDISDKKVTVTIYVKHLPTGEKYFEAKLGDVYVEATKRI